MQLGFETYLARVYGSSWLAGGVIGGLGWWLLGSMLAGGIVGVIGKGAVVRLGTRYLHWRAAARRAGIEQTLPGAIRYLRVLATGSGDLQSMLERIAHNRKAYGQTALALQRALNRAAMTGSLPRGLRSVARDTPSDTLAPVLLQLQETAAQGREELQSYLRLEARILSHQQTRQQDEREGLIEVLAELFVVLLAAPALFVIIIAVWSVLSAGLGRAVITPVGPRPARAVLLTAAAIGILVIGLTAAYIVQSLRPPEVNTPDRVPTTLRSLVVTAPNNPASMAILASPIGLAVGLGAGALGESVVNAGLGGYAVWGLLVGAIAMRRQRIDDTRDRELRDFVHALAGAVTLGRPLPNAIETVRTELEFRAIDAELDDLAMRANVTTYPDDVRTRALERFADDVGTPLARQVIELLTGGIEAGSDPEAVFEALETDVDRLYHQKRAIETAMGAYVLVGWTTALLVIVIGLAVSTYVLDGLTQLTTVAGADTEIVFTGSDIEQQAMQSRIYRVIQASMLASGWFAGAATGGMYKGLFHSGALVGIALVAFRVVGVA